MAGQCITTVVPRVSIGILGRGTESFRDGPPRRCLRAATVDGLRCAQHDAIHRHVVETNARRRAEAV